MSPSLGQQNNYLGLSMPGNSPPVNSLDATLLYQSVVIWSRHPHFYTHLGLSDTPWVRFELLSLHLSIVMLGINKAVRQGLVEALVDDLDASVQELIVSDLKVGRHVKQLVRSFYGRLQAYRQAIEADDEEALQALIARCHFHAEGGLTHEQVASLATYALTFYGWVLSVKGLSDA